MPGVGAPLIQPIPFSVTVQPGSTPAAPVTFPVNIGDVWCHAVEIQVPVGPGGSMGFLLEYAGTPIVPFSSTPTFLVVDDYEHTYEIESELASSLAVVAYNQGFWPHTIYMRFMATPIAAYLTGGGAGIGTPLDLSNLGSGGS